MDAWAGLAATTLYRQTKRFFADCADVQRGQGDAKGAGRFEQASTHWMRHSDASHAIAAGMPIEIAQQNLGHAWLATTTMLPNSLPMTRAPPTGTWPLLKPTPEPYIAQEPRTPSPSGGPVQRGLPDAADIASAVMLRSGGG